MKESAWVLDWSGAALAGARVAGGKGWNLGRLHRYGFPVPAGGVVVAEAYRRFMAVPALESQCARLREVQAEDVYTPEVAGRLAQLRQAIVDTELPADVADQIRSFLSARGLEHAPVAVRSSATAEDGAAASFAGIHESFLGRCGPDEVVQAVKACYASLWTPRALGYRRKFQLADEDVACAVVICAMVTAPGRPAPVAAGVAFSCDPMTGRRDLVVINAAPGLGDAVVGGEVNPEQIAVIVGHGGMRVAERGGRAREVLPDEQALALSRLTWRVYWALGDGQDPQDVEWAYDGTHFWLLQARPVTNLPRWTFPGAGQLPVIWSNANVKDAIPLVLTTFSWDWMQRSLQHIFWAPFVACGYPLVPGQEVVRRFSGRLYLDMTSFQWAAYDGLGIPPAEMNRQAGGYQPEIPVPPGNPLAGPAGRPRMWRRIRLLWTGLRFSRQIPAEMAVASEKLRQMRQTDLSRQSRRQLLETATELVRASLSFGCRFHLGNFITGMWQNALLTVLERSAPEQALSLTSGLMAGGGQVTSAEHGYRLYDLAAAAQQDQAALAYLQTEPLDPQGWRSLPPDSPFRQEVERFLAEFGHRAVYEAELANPRWREDPTYLLTQVRLLLAAQQTERPAAAAQATRRAAETALARLPWILRPAIRWLAGRTRLAAAQREAAKSTFSAFGELARRIGLAVGRDMAAAGALADAADIFDLSLADMEAYLREEWDGTGAQALVEDRRAKRRRWLAEVPPDVISPDARGRALDLAQATPGPAQTAPPATAAGVLTGIGVAAGVGRGRARIVRHPEDGYALQPGEVLVAPSTDPGWTPLFLRAAAVVMEVGGYLSHGAIVAREFGIPAVVNIPGLLDQVKDGDYLTVNGNVGQVLRHGGEP